MNENNNPLDFELVQISQDISTETDANKLNELIQLFNTNQYKKNIVRNQQFNSLLDKILVQMEQRVDKRADTFSNKDLLDYMIAVQQAINKNEDHFQETEAVPLIQINKNEINVHNDLPELSRESKEKVKDVIEKILNQNKLQDIPDVPYTNKTEE